MLQRAKRVIRAFNVDAILCVSLLVVAAFAVSVSFSARSLAVADDAALSRVFGGAPEDVGTCCIKGSLTCGGWTNGCQNSKFKCKDANSCAAGTIKQNIYGSSYPNASCAAATGANGTTLLPNITCYQTVQCPNSCTLNGKYFYCDAGNNPVAGPQVTPSQPDNTTCPQN